MVKITQELRQAYTDKFKDTFGVDEYYIVAAKTQEFTGNTIPEATDSVYGTFLSTYDEVLFGKRLESSDVSYMIRNIPWEEGGKYTPYSHLETGLHDKNFYVCADQDDGSYAVFKCIHKTPFVDPTVFDKPLLSETSAYDESYTTSDGYQWKYMFSISAVNYSKFATENFIPVIEDSDVTANAVSGTIDAMIVDSTGALYNSYGSGRFSEIDINGNTLRHSIVSDTFSTVSTYDLISANGTFVEGPVIISVDGDTSNGTIHLVGTNYISLVIDSETESITQSTISTANSVTVETANATAEVIGIRRESIPDLATENDFYNTSSLYIARGSGAGQIRNIVDYQVSGDQYIVTLDEEFNTSPDTTSYFIIRPQIKVVGDGTGAKALPIIDPTANTINDVQIIDRGQGYTYATTVITGNTGIVSANGSVVNPNEARITPVIAPTNGHGSSPEKELFGSTLGISAQFINGEVSIEYPFSKIAIVKNPKFNNLIMDLTAYDDEYTNGEVIIQEGTNASAIFVEGDSVNNNITMTNVSGIFDASNTIIGQVSNTSLVPTSINNDMTTFSNVVELDVTVSSGTFEVGDIISFEEASAYVAKVTASKLYITDRLGDFVAGTVVTGSLTGAIATINTVGETELVDNSGEVLYIETSEQITRSNTTTETVKLILDI